jgi:hypothetical protein
LSWPFVHAFPNASTAYLDVLYFTERAFDPFESIAADTNGDLALREHRGDVEPLLEEIPPIAREAENSTRSARDPRWAQGSHRSRAARSSPNQ